ncbi:hypothetical protein KR044_012481 [Drosophila immigrans]|nr:hypothetical protein KR044_012481 [Drosophila immigrans]
MLQQVIGCLIIAICLMHSANSLYCYQCDSLVDSYCNQSVVDENRHHNGRRVNCDLREKPTNLGPLNAVTRCDLVVSTIAYPDRNVTVTSRDCHYEAIGQKDNECRLANGAKVLSCYICKGDMCNASGAASFGAFSVAALLALFVMQRTL